MVCRVLRSLSAVLLLTIPLFGREKSDVIVLKNGDRLTCEIQSLAMGVLYVTHDDVDGTIRIQWSKVDHLESRHLFIIKTQDGSLYTGTLSTERMPDSRSTMFRVRSAPDQEVDLAASQVTELTETSRNLWERFDGVFSFGMVYSKANRNTQYSLSSETEYTREQWGAAAGYNSSLSSTSGTTVATRNSASLTGYHLLPWANYFYAGLADFLQSSEQGIDLQTTLGGGLGKYLKNGRNTRISVLGGLAWQRTAYRQSSVSQPHQNVASGFVSADLRFFKFSATNLSVNATVFPAFSDFGRVRFTTNATYYVKLLSNLKWDLSFYGNWDNHPPPNFAAADYGTSVGLSWTYGTR